MHGSFGRRIYTLKPLHVAASPSVVENDDSLPHMVVAVSSRTVGA